MPIFQTIYDQESYKQYTFNYTKQCPTYKPVDSAFIDDKEDVAYLSDNGFLQERQLGEQLRAKYANLLTRVSPERVLARYTDF